MNRTMINQADIEASVFQPYGTSLESRFIVSNMRNWDPSLGCAGQ